MKKSIKDRLAQSKEYSKDLLKKTGQGFAIGMGVAGGLMIMNECLRHLYILVHGHSMLGF